MRSQFLRESPHICDDVLKGSFGESAIFLRQVTKKVSYEMMGNGSRITIVMGPFKVIQEVEMNVSVGMVKGRQPISWTFVMIGIMALRPEALNVCPIPIGSPSHAHHPLTPQISQKNRITIGCLPELLDLSIQMPSKMIRVIHCEEINVNVHCNSVMIINTSLQPKRFNCIGLQSQSMSKSKYDQGEEFGIEMSDKKVMDAKRAQRQYRNGKNLDDLPQQLFENVIRILRDHSHSRMFQKNKLKLYSLFYVDPLDTKTGIWDFFIIFSIYLFQIQISLTLGFGPTFWQDQLSSKFYTICYVILIIIFIVDVIINFHKGYYAFGRGKVIDDHILIIKHYLKIYFAMDLVTIGTLIIPLVQSDYILNFVQLLPATLLYLKKFRYQNQITGMLQYHKKFRIFFILFMLGCDVLLIGHFGACIFVGIDLLLWRLQYYGNDPQYYWLSNNSMYEPSLIDGPWVLQYIYAQSFSTGTLSTIAPGPFGKNAIEVFYSNLVMIFFMLLASYAAQVLVSILLSEDEIRTFHEDNIQKFDSFMKLKGIKEDISRKIHNFFELVWETEVKMNIQDEHEVLQKLPTTLRDQLIIEMQFVKNLKLLTFFSNHDLLLRLISLKVTSNIIDSDRILFTVGVPPASIEQRYLYHFKDGLAKFFIQNGKEEYTIALSNIQRTVGQFQFLTGLAYSYSCKSVELCIISKVANSDMLEAIQQNGMHEEYQVLKYKLLIENELHLISKVCLVCQENHTESNCEEIYPAIAIEEGYKYKLGRTCKERKKYVRKNWKNKRVFTIDERMIIKAHIICIFLIYRNLRILSQKSGDTIDRVDNHQKFYTGFNLDQVGN